LPVSTIKWDLQKAQGAALLALERGITRATLLLESRVVDSINIGQPVKRLKSGRLVGLDPSKPGEPPHVLYGRLKQSITHQVEVAEKEVIGRVGTNVEYARALELGFEGKGRKLAARPYLRPALEKNKTALMNAFAKG